MQWWATVTFYVTTLPLPLIKKKKQVVSNFALQTTTTFVKKRFNDFFCQVVLIIRFYESINIRPESKHNNLIFQWQIKIN